MERDAMYAELLAFVKSIADYELCDDKPLLEPCRHDSGPYCGAHDPVVIDSEVFAARVLVAKAEGV